jgi:hypothetical protein
MTNYLKLLSLVTVAAAGACAHEGLQSPNTSRVMGYDECVASSTCSAEGVVSLQEIDGIKMGRLEFENGRCIAVSFPETFFRENTLPKRIRVEGRIYRGHHDPNFLLLEIDGRGISYSPCGEVYLFVR